MGTIDRADLHRQIDALSSELLDVVERSPDVMAGLPVFRGTRGAGQGAARLPGRRTAWTSSSTTFRPFAASKRSRCWNSPASSCRACSSSDPHMARRVLGAHHTGCVRDLRPPRSAHYQADEQFLTSLR